MCKHDPSPRTSCVTFSFLATSHTYSMSSKLGQLALLPFLAAFVSAILQLFNEFQTETNRELFLVKSSHFGRIKEKE